MGRIVNKIEIQDKLFDSDLDLYVIFGHATGKSKKPYKVGWMSRDQSKLIEIKHFKDKTEASAHFNDVAYGEITPDSNAVYKDHQKYRLYEWENTYVDPFSIPMNESEMRKFTRLIARKEGMKAPKINFIEQGKSSGYYFEDRRIEYSHRDNLTVIHEMAHAIHHARNSYNDKDYVSHGPQYVWILIDLYSKYANFNLQYLAVTAHQSGILGDLNTPQIMQKFQSLNND